MRLFILLLLASPVALAQKISIKGVLKDTTNAPLPSATILLLNPQDSSLLNFGVTGVDGSFEIRNLNRQRYLFKVTFVGYAPLTQVIQPNAEENVVDMGSLHMKPETRTLDEITVESERAPVTVKRDTIEFNAGSFKTRENAMVEDLLKRLPGIEVDNDGTIRAQGEQVRRVTVDGKNFFGNDPKIATRNLPADAISKVQVFDRKSDQSQFTGIDDGVREKTINLELKEEKRNGAFGNITAGVGTDERYQGRASINKFRKGQQLSFLGMANNINEQGFGIDEYMNFTGGSRQMMSGRSSAVRLEFSDNNQNGVPLNFGGRNNGLMNSYAGGLNFNKDFSKKTELNSSYFYNHLDHDLVQALERINTLPSGNLTFNQQSRQHNTNDNHRVNAVLEHKIDSLNSLRLTTNASYNVTDTRQISDSENRDAHNSLVNESNRATMSSGNALNVNGTLLWRHRFNKKGRTLATTLQYGLSQSDREGAVDATINQYRGVPQTTTIAQHNFQANSNWMYGATLAYTEPLGNRKYVEANYTYRQNVNDVNREVYNIGNEQRTLDEQLSNQYQSDYQYHRAGLNFRVNRSKYNVTIGSSIQQTYLTGDLKRYENGELKSVHITRTNQNFLPVVRFNYDFSTSKHLRLDYETSVQEPTIQQLQPVVDNSDPLNIYEGNPALRPAYAQNWRLNFTSFNPATFMSFFAFVDAAYITNAITLSQTISNGVRTSVPVNVDENLRINGNASFGFPIQKIKSRLSITGNAMHQQGLNVVNDTESRIAQNSLGGRLRYDYRYKDIFDVSLGANLSRVTTSYEFNEQADQLYFNNALTSEANLTFLKNYQFNGAFEYLVYENKTNQFEQAIPLLNLSVSRFLLKGKSGQLKFSVNNLLDQNIGVTQTADINYIERQTSNALGRFYMVSFTYALNKQLNPLGMRPGGGMIRIMR